MSRFTEQPDHIDKSKMQALASYSAYSTIGVILKMKFVQEYHERGGFGKSQLSNLRPVSEMRP